MTAPCIASAHSTHTATALTNHALTPALPFPIEILVGSRFFAGRFRLAVVEMRTVVSCGVSGLVSFALPVVGLFGIPSIGLTEYSCRSGLLDMSTRFYIEGYCLVRTSANLSNQHWGGANEAYCRL